MSGTASDADIGRILRGEPRQLGRYVVNERLGDGGLGIVFKGYDPLLQRPVALKILNQDSPQGRQDLVREGRAMVDHVRHDNICAIYDVGEANGAAFLVMELLDGPTLRKRLPEYLGEPRKVAALVATLADAVGHFHETAKIVHRDLKPENVVFTRRNGREVAVIIDFGLAKQLGGTRQTTTGVAKGTQFYMSPEQARGQVDKIGYTTDIYALGIMICELLTGHYPQEGRTPSGGTRPCVSWTRRLPRSLSSSSGTAWSQIQRSVTRAPRPSPSTCAVTFRTSPSSSRAIPGWSQRSAGCGRGANGWGLPCWSSSSP